MDKNHYDVIVCGGGVAGISAALAAARSGVRTCLLEKEYALGGLATLGLIVVYLPLCDGNGMQMSAGISEELLKLSLKYGPGEIPEGWREKDGNMTEKKRTLRYEAEYNAASFMIAAEELLLSHGVRIVYDARVLGAERSGNNISSVQIATKTGQQSIYAKAFIDASGDGDVCYFSKEQTVEDNTNRRTGWYFSFDGKRLQRHAQTDPVNSDLPPSSRLYSGTDIEEISQHCIDGRNMIKEHFLNMREKGKNQVYPLIIPAFHGLRMTRRLAGTFEFSEDLHEGVWFHDAIGMIGNWKVRNKRYSIPYRCIKAIENHNLFAAGRCIAADKSGWDLTRVIPSCAVTGQAAGAAAAFLAKNGKLPDINRLQSSLSSQGVLLDPSLFSQQK